MTGIFRLNVRHLETGELTKHDLSVPFALLGRDPACHIQLSDPAVSRRHTYVQVLEGRLYCFDLGSRTGIRFRDGLRVEGILSGTDSLVIGPYQIRLSQAPAYRLACSGDSGPDFDNRHTEDAHLAFRNAQGRSSRSGSRQLRERVTLVGRCGRCHVKLSDASVGHVHASIVRTPVGHWFVNLRPDKDSTLRGREVLCEPLSKDDKLEIGRFRMRFSTGTTAVSNELSHKELGQLEVPPDREQSSERQIVRNRRPTRRSRRRREDQSTGLSEQVLLAALDQFGQMQQQLLGQTHQQSMMLARMIAAMQQEHNSAIYDQIARIQAVTDELVSLKRPRLELKSEIQQNISNVGEVSSVARRVDAESEVDVHVEPVSPTSSSGEETQERLVESERQGSHPAARNPKDAPDRTEAYHRVTRRIHELERERSRGWQKVMSLLGVGDVEN